MPNLEKFREALGGVEKAGDLSLPSGSPGRGLLLRASRGEGRVSALSARTHPAAPGELPANFYP